MCLRDESSDQRETLYFRKALEFPKEAISFFLKKNYSLEGLRDVGEVPRHLSYIIIAAITIISILLYCDYCYYSLLLCISIVIIM